MIDPDPSAGLPDRLFAEFVSVFGRGAVGKFLEAAAESCQIVKAGLKGNIRNRNILCQHGLCCLNPLVA